MKFYVSKEDAGFDALKQVIGEKLKTSPNEASVKLPASLQINLCEKRAVRTARKKRHEEYDVVETMTLPEGLEVSLFVTTSNMHGGFSSKRDAGRAVIRSLGVPRQENGREITEYFSLYIDFSVREIAKTPIPARSFIRAN